MTFADQLRQGKPRSPMEYPAQPQGRALVRSGEKAATLVAGRSKTHQRAAEAHWLDHEKFTNFHESVI